MIKVALTGGIGSGKTIAASIFEKLGVPVFYADAEAKRIMVTNAEIISDIKGLLGEMAYSFGSLDKVHIAGKVFNNPELLHSLNKIVHPAVHLEFTAWSAKQHNMPYIIEETAIIIESGAHKYFDRIIMVTAPEKVRVARVQKRDNISEELVRERMKNQMPEEEKIRFADFIINNDIDSMILPQILEINEKLISLYRNNK